MFNLAATGLWVRRTILLAAVAASIALSALAWADASAIGLIVSIRWSLPL